MEVVKIIRDISNLKLTEMWISQNDEKRVFVQFKFKNKEGYAFGDYMVILNKIKNGDGLVINYVGENDDDVVSRANFTLTPQQEKELFDYVNNN